MQIFTVAALAAAGKTYNATRFSIAGLRAGEKYIFCVPSTKLVSQIEADCRKAGCSAVTAMHTDDGVDGSVVARLTKHFQTTAYDRGEIVVMTMAAMERLKYIERRHVWNLIVDELPSPVYHERFSLHENRDLLLSLLSEQPWNAAYTMVSASETDTGLVMDRACNGRDDQFTRQLADTANKLLSDHWNCFALNDQLARFRQPKDGVNAIDLFGLLQPTVFDGFKSVTLMGACLDQSLIYRYWLSLGVEFLPHPVIKPRFAAYPNADLVTIQYAIDRDWSAKLRDSVIDGRRVIEVIADRCRAALNGKRFVYLVNKSEDKLTLANGIPLPHVSHGLNHFASYHNAMLLSALNPPPAYFGFCNDMVGISDEELRTAIYRTSTYQAAARISIRNLDDRHRKRIQVVDQPTAIWLADLIGTNRVEKLPGEEIVPQDRRRVSQPKTNAEKLVTSRQNRQTELVASLDYVNGFNEVSPENPRHGILYTKACGVSENTHVGTIFSDKFAKIGIDTNGLSVASFRTLLAELHLRVIKAKDYNQLGCSCMFDPELDAVTSRGNANIISMSGIWLDNDGGDLTPGDFARMFKVPLVIYNSFSSTIKNPRWRVWIPTSHLITPAVHKELVAQIRKMLIDRKYYGASYIKKHPDRPVKHHGFDEGKLTQAVLFYLPCQAGAGSGASFFDEYHWDAAPLNPYEWIDRSIIDHRAPTIPQAAQPPSDVPQNVNQAKIEAANENWRNHAAETGNRAFFKLGVAYSHAGLSWCEAEPLLRQQAQFAHGQKSVSERLSDLKGYGRKIGW